MSIPIPPPPPGPLPGFPLPPNGPIPGGKTGGRPPLPADSKDKSDGKKADNKPGAKTPALQPFKSSIHYFLFQRKPKHLLKSGQSVSWEHVTRAEMGGMSKDEIEEELARYRRSCRKNGRNIAHDYAALTNHYRRRALDELLTSKMTNEKDLRAQWHLVALFLKKKRINWCQEETVEMHAIIQRSEKSGVSVAPPVEPRVAAPAGAGMKDKTKENPPEKPPNPDSSGNASSIINVPPPIPPPLPPPPNGFRRPEGDLFGPHAGPIRAPGGPWFPNDPHQPIDLRSRLNPFMPNLDTGEHAAPPNPRRAPPQANPNPNDLAPFETQPLVQQVHNHYYGGPHHERPDSPVEDHNYDERYAEPHHESERDRITREYEGAPFMPKVQDVEGSQHPKSSDEWDKYSPNTQRHRSQKVIEAPHSPRMPCRQHKHVERKVETRRNHQNHQPNKHYHAGSSTDSSVSIAGSSVFSRAGDSEFTRASSPGDEILHPRGSIHRQTQDRGREVAQHHEPVYRKHHKPHPVRPQGPHRALTPPQIRMYRQPQNIRRDNYHDDYLEASRPPFNYRPISRAVSPRRPPPLPRSYAYGSPASSPRVTYRRHVTHDSPSLDRLSLHDDYQPSRRGFNEEDQHREAVRHMMRDSRRRRSMDNMRGQYEYDYDQRRRGRVDDGYYS